MIPAIPQNSEWEALAYEPYNPRSQYPRCPRCPHSWHGLQCRANNACVCPTSFEEEEEETGD